MAQKPWAADADAPAALGLDETTQQQKLVPIGSY